MTPHTISIQFDSESHTFDLYDVDDDGEMSFIEAHEHFFDAQQHACMLLSPNGDFRLSILPPPPAHEMHSPLHSHSHENVLSFEPAPNSALDPAIGLVEPSND